MSDINNNININVQAQYESLNKLLTSLEEAKKLFGSLSKARINFDIKKDIQKSADPIMKASQYFETAIKNLKNAQNSIVKSMATGSAVKIEEAKKKLADAEQFAKNVIKTIEHTPAVNVAKQTITEDYGRYQAEEESRRFSIEEEANRNKSAMADLEAFERSLDPIKQKAYELGMALSRARQDFIALNKSGRDTKQAEKSIKKLKKQMQDLEASTKKTSNSWKVLLGRIKNIAIYRAIRTVLHTIMQTITTGFERVVKLNKEAEQTALRLKADYNLIATAIGSIAYTAMEAFIGSIDDATNSLLNMLNSFNKVLALALGSDRYFKVVRKGIDGISQSTKKLSFDKFEALSEKDEDTLGVDLEEIKLADTEINNLTNSEQNLYKILVSIKEIFGDIWEVVTQIWNGIVVPILNSGFVSGLVDIVATLVSILNHTGLLKVALVGIIGLGVVSKITKIINVLKNLNGVWGKTIALIGIFIGVFTFVDSLLNGFTGTAKIVVSTVMMILGAVVAIYSAIQLVKNAWTGFGAIAIALSAGAVALAGLKGIVDGASGYENGGIPEKSELFYMNEYGKPEALVNTGGRETNVINMTQLAQGMKQGFVEAIYETGLIDAMQNRIVIEGDNVNDNAFARAIFPALKTESRRRGGNQL